MSADQRRILVREPIADSGLELLRRRFEVVEDSESDLASIIGGFDAIIVRSATKVDASLIERGARLRVIGRAGVGVDNVDVEAATRRGIVVANAAESTVDSAAEHAIALLLALARNVPQAHAALTSGTWDRQRFTGIELAGKTLGVLGLGRIGRQVAHRALGLVDALAQPGEVEARVELQLGCHYQILWPEVHGAHVDDALHVCAPAQRGADLLFHLGLGSLADQQALHLP